MAFPKGRPNPNAGRPTGAANKATLGARQAIAHFVDSNANRLVGWLDQIALDDPKAAFDRYMSVVEYHIPKLQRIDQTIEGGNSFVVNILKLGDNPEALEQMRLQLTKESVKTITHEQAHGQSTKESPSE